MLYKEYHALTYHLKPYVRKEQWNVLMMERYLMRMFSTTFAIYPRRFLFRPRVNNILRDRPRLLRLLYLIFVWQVLQVTVMCWSKIPKIKAQSNINWFQKIHYTKHSYMRSRYISWSSLFTHASWILNWLKHWSTKPCRSTIFLHF